MTLRDFSCLAFIFFLACTGNKNTSSEAICIERSGSVYNAPNVMNPSSSVLKLGDKVTVINKDAKKYGEFVAVRLVNGSTGWTIRKDILSDAQPAAIIENTIIFSLPDSLSGRTGKFFIAEFAALTEQSGEWVKITGTGRTKEGWTKRKNLSLEKSDIDIAILAHSELLDTNGKIISEALPYFITILPDKGSLLAKKLEKLAEKNVTDAIEESIRDYEENAIENI